MSVLEREDKPRRWKAWAILEKDGSLHRLSMEGPEESESLRGLIKMGWFAIPINVTEILDS